MQITLEKCRQTGVAETREKGPGQRPSVCRGGPGPVLLGSRARLGQQDTGSRRAGGGGACRINRALRTMGEASGEWDATAAAMVRAVSSQHSRVRRPGARDNNTAFLGHGAWWRRDGDLGTASLLAERCNKGGSQSVNQSMRCPRKAQVPTLRTLSLVLVVKQGFPGRAGGSRGDRTVQ